MTSISIIKSRYNRWVVNALEDWKENARKSLIEHIVAEIDIHKNPTEVYLDVFHAVAKRGLIMKAQKKGLLDNEMWHSKRNLPEQIKDLESFLRKEIK